MPPWPPQLQAAAVTIEDAAASELSYSGQPSRHGLEFGEFIALGQYEEHRRHRTDLLCRGRQDAGRLFLGALRFGRASTVGLSARTEARPQREIVHTARRDRGRSHVRY